MPLFKIADGALQQLTSSYFASEHTEERLESILAASGAELGVCWIARQPQTALRKRPDLIGIAADGAVVVWELKRGRAPREMVAQALEYAAWVATLDVEALRQLSNQFDAGRELEDRLREVFGTDEEDWSQPALNRRQRIVLVAEGFEPETLDVCRWLSQQGVGLFCWQFAYHRGPSGEELLAVEQLTWSARTDEPAPGGRQLAGRGDRGFFKDAVAKLRPRVSDLCKEGRLRVRSTFWVYAGRCIVTELFLEDAGPVGLDIYYDVVVGRAPEIMVRFIGRGWDRRPVRPRIETVRHYGENVRERLAATFGQASYQPDGPNGYPAWRLPVPTNLGESGWTPELVAEHAERVIRALAAAVPFRGQDESN